MKLILRGEPRSTSHVYHYHCKFGRPSGYMTPEGKVLKEDYAWQLRVQYKKPPLTEDVRVSAVLFFGTKRKHDIDNFNKLFFDAMSGIVWVDDAQVEELHLLKRYDKDDPRIEVEVEVIHKH